ncbi:MAG: acetyl coenzyme synthetase [Pseudomonadota bacterium]|jgi:acetyl-CoA synthetase
MSNTIKPSPEFAKSANINWSQYLHEYEQSIKEPDVFWSQKAERLHWFERWKNVRDISYHSPVKIEWFRGAKLNVSYNCLDRHLALHADKTAMIFEPDSPQTPSQKITYQQAYNEVNKMANALKKMGVKKGDRVTIYMPMIPEAVYSMLACARVGAIHSVVFGGFSPDSIVDRIKDCKSQFVITADEGLRGGKRIHLKNNIDEALAKCPEVNQVLVIRHTGADVGFKKGRDVWWHEIKNSVADYCEPEIMDAEDPLFILYTSGSTNKPKGVLHTTGGYLLYAAYTHELVFDYKPNDIYWCTADVGWVTGHSYIVYGPMANAATSVIFEGVPNYPTTSRFWEVVDKHKVTIFYTAPTALRALMREGDAPVKKTSRESLRLLGSVGEPINPEAWLWYHRVVGENRCPVVDTWWQTETGGILISPLPGATPLKPGSATLPMMGVSPVVLTPDGQRIPADQACEGVLCLEGSWPGQMRTVYGDHDRFELTYFSQYKGYYFTGDGCRRDEDGYYWITGRVDDVLNVAGHRLGTAELESVLVAHSTVAEAAVVGFPHDIKGQGIYCFVTLKTGVTPSDELRKELIQWVRKEISPIATPDRLQWAPALPKTRSGKIMRRILRKIAENQIESIGDTSTLADPAVVTDLLNNRIHD